MVGWLSLIQVIRKSLLAAGIGNGYFDQPLGGNLRKAQAASQFSCPCMHLCFAGVVARSLACCVLEPGGASHQCSTTCKQGQQCVVDGVNGMAHASQCRGSKPGRRCDHEAMVPGR